MVPFHLDEMPGSVGFQYSLCRVVLMVPNKVMAILALDRLSVLALSSRFDGRGKAPTHFSALKSFSTRSVESF